MARNLWKSWKVHVKLQSLFPEDVCSQTQWQKNAQGPWPPAFLTCSICISPFWWPAGATSRPQILGQGHAQLVLTEASSKTSTFVTRFDPWVYWVPWILLKVYSHPPELFFSGGWASDFFFFHCLNTPSRFSPWQLLPSYVCTVLFQVALSLRTSSHASLIELWQMQKCSLSSNI